MIQFHIIRTQWNGWNDYYITCRKCCRILSTTVRVSKKSPKTPHLTFPSLNMIMYRLAMLSVAFWHCCCRPTTSSRLYCWPSVHPLAAQHHLGHRTRTEMSNAVEYRVIDNVVGFDTLRRILSRQLANGRSLWWVA